MKDGFSLLLVCLVAVAGVAMWLLGIDSLVPFHSPNVIVGQEREPPPDESSREKTKQAAKPAGSRIPQTRAVIEPAPTQEDSPVAPMVAGDQLPAGTQKETTGNAYGDLALSTRRVDRGRDLETLVYTRDRGKEVTVISLEDGKVSSTYTQTGLTPAVDTTRPQPDEHTAASLASPTAAEPPDRPLAQDSMGRCGEYRDGKLTVKPCSQVPISPSEWLAKGSGR